MAEDTAQLDGTENVRGAKEQERKDRGRNVEDDWMLDQSVVGSVYRGKDGISKHYKLGRKIGSGAFAVVVAASSRINKRPYAVITALPRC